MSTQPKAGAVSPIEKLTTLFRRFTNAHFATCADEYREGVSDASVKRRYDASLQAENAFWDALKAELISRETGAKELEEAVRPRRSLNDADDAATIRRVFAECETLKAGMKELADALTQIANEESPGERGDFGAGEDSVINRHAELARAALARYNGGKQP